MSWKALESFGSPSARQSSSLWGCELKGLWKGCKAEKRKVILLVRMWVERYGVKDDKGEYLVILLVRMWVERLWVRMDLEQKASSSLWGCELKGKNYHIHRVRPLSSSLWGCELKDGGKVVFIPEPGSSSLWGCELKEKNRVWRMNRSRSSSLWGCELKEFCTTI